LSFEEQLVYSTYHQLLDFRFEAVVYIEDSGRVDVDGFRRKG
jgi:hypothetical protein